MHRHITFHSLKLFDETTVAIGCLVFAGKYSEYSMTIGTFIKAYFQFIVCSPPSSKCVALKREQIAEMENLILSLEDHEPE